MARIVWIADDDASGQIADVYRELKQTSLKGNVPEILRTMSLRPTSCEPSTRRPGCTSPMARSAELSTK